MKNSRRMLMLNVTILPFRPPPPPCALWIWYLSCGRWRATARVQLLLARAAERAVSAANPAAADYQELVAAANTARGTAEAAQVARAAREDEELAARAALAAALTGQQCGATGGLPVDCVVSEWSVQEACPADASYSCGSSTKLESRTVVQAAM